MTWVNPEDGRNNPKIEEYLKAADMAVVFEDHLETLEAVMQKGAVVIGHEKSAFLQNYHPNDETGNAFTYATINPWEVFTAMVRAIETYRFPYDWQNIIRGILKTNFN
jgi:glycogen synthase